MSIIGKESIKAIAESCGVGELRDDVATCIAPDVEYGSLMCSYALSYFFLSPLNHALIPYYFYTIVLMESIMNYNHCR